MTSIGNYMIRLPLGRLTTAWLFAASLLLSGGSANAGILLASSGDAAISGIQSASAVTFWDIADVIRRQLDAENDDQPYLCEAEAMSSSNPSISTSVDVAFGALPREVGSNAELLVVAYRLELVLTYANPFLDGMLRPPEGHSLV